VGQSESRRTAYAYIRCSTFSDLKLVTLLLKVLGEFLKAKLEVLCH